MQLQIKRPGSLQSKAPMTMTRTFQILPCLTYSCFPCDLCTLWQLPETGGVFVTNKSQKGKVKCDGGEFSHDTTMSSQSIPYVNQGKTAGTHAGELMTMVALKDHFTHCCYECFQSIIMIHKSIMNPSRHGNLL